VRQPSLLPVACAVLACAAPPGAEARTTRFAIPEPSGVVLNGSRVAWSQSLPGGGVEIRSASYSGGAPATVGVRPGVPEYVFGADLAASPTWLAADATAFDRYPFGDRSFVFHDVLAGRAGGALTRRTHRCAFYSTPLPAAVDVSRDRMISARCSKPGATIANLRDGSTVKLPASQRGLRVAGRYAAWVDGEREQFHDAVVVYDTARSAVSYTIPATRARISVEDLDLADDGTVVVSYLGRHLAWASPAAPTPHAIPLPGSTHFLFVKLEDGVVAFERGRRPTGASVPRAEVGVTDFAGNARIIARGAASVLSARRFDFDGRRVAWVSYSCRGARLHVQPVGSEPVDESLTRCPLRLRKPPRVKRGRYVVLRFSCHGYAGPNCIARRVRLAARARGATVLVAKGGRGRHVALTGDGRQLLHDRRTLRVRVAATLTDDAGTRERRHGRALLRR
jgi:hypothetical protein